MVFQSAMNSLNPVVSLRRQFSDIFQAHLPDLDRQARDERSRELLEMVGIDPSRLNGFPHELSGGMRQRVGIAMALALSPEIVIMDEPTTALDVVVQREILLEVARLRRELGFSVIFITHDLPMLIDLSDRIAVMYAGEIVEEAPAALMGGSPAHPYTLGLEAACPDLFGERTAHRGRDGCQRSESGQMAADHAENCDAEENDRGRNEPPKHRNEGFGPRDAEDVQLVAAHQLRCRHEDLRMIAPQEALVADERRARNDGHAAASHVYPQNLHSVYAR